jgi:signal transduction histidine kinase
MNFTEQENNPINHAELFCPASGEHELLNPEDLLEKLRVANELAEEYHRLKSNFIANISHEMRTPLNAILGFAELSEMEDVTLEEMREYMQIIRKSSEQLLETIKDVLYIATVDGSEISLQHDPVSYRGLVQDLEEYYQYFNEEGLKPGVELRFKSYGNQEDTFVSDAEKLNLVFRKLIDNGLKFTNKGYVEVGCLDPDESFVHFYVKDTGIGMPEDKIRLMFEPFRTMDESHSHEYGGSGLGLSIVQRLVRLMGGEVSIHSKPDVGTTVHFSIKPFNEP